MRGSSAARDVAAARQATQSNRMVGFSMKGSSSISTLRMDATSDNRESRLRKPAHISNNPVSLAIYVRSRRRNAQLRDAYKRQQFSGTIMSSWFGSGFGFSRLNRTDL